MKRKLLLFMAAALLCGAASAQHPWGDNPNSHAQPSNTPIVASVQIDDVAVTINENMRLGAFVGDDLHGIAAPHDGNFWIQVFYTAQTDNITFKFYDGETEYTTCETTLAGETVTLTGQDEGYGTPATPVVLNFTATQTQTVAMGSGWNWWSSYIELGTDALTQLENGLGNNGIQIQSRVDGYANRNEYMGYVYWSGPLSNIYNEQMYMIQTNAACDVSISGQRASATNHPITINKDWNWIGYPNSQSMAIADAMSGFTPEAGDQIKGRDGYANYSTYGSYGWWSGTISTLEPGQGYMYKSNSDASKTLIYQTGSRGENPIANINWTNNSFQPEHENFAYNMTVTAVVELDGEEVRSDSYEVAAFVGNQCRGSVKLMYVEPLGRYEAFLLIFGESTESLRFVLTDGKETSWSDEHLMFGINDIIGTTMEPAVLHFGPMGVDDNSQKLINVYPNPSNDVFNVEGVGIQKIEVLDNFGRIILSKESESEFVKIDLSDRSTGAYLLRVVTNNEVFTSKLIKK